MSANDFAAVAELLADDFVVDCPQSGERWPGAERYTGLGRKHPAPGSLRFSVDRVVDGGAAEAVSDVAVSDGLQQTRVISFFDCDPVAGRVRRIVEFWPGPCPAPAWCAQQAAAPADGEGARTD